MELFWRPLYSILFRESKLQNGHKWLASKVSKDKLKKYIQNKV